MGVIRILAPEVAAKIAAGEVVERPASVVKELVENSLDAGAARITVEIEDGGKKVVRVEDDGCGMSREDALLCFERHATSKISASDDILNVSTRGFRGEAMPSIADVSRLQLWTNDLSAESGTYVRVEAGVKERVEDAALPRGTIVQVSDLFFNFPAREKFMKTAGGEAGQIMRAVELAALSAPAVSFKTVSNGRRQLHLEPAASALERIRQVCGDQVELLEFEESSGPFSWHGFIVPPLERTVERPFQHLFVNGRPVKDRTLAFAVRRAYQEYLQRDTNPSAVIYLKVAPGIVDVNVHPTKIEVKFLDTSEVFKSLQGAVKRRLGRLQSFVSLGLAGAVATPRGTGDGSPGVPVLPLQPRFPPPVRSDSTPSPPAQQSLMAAPSGLREEPFTILGQYADSFIVVSMRDGILIVDQHNAHERALYERYCSQLSAIPSQKFLLPPILDLSEAAFAAIMEQAPVLANYGLHVEEAGPRSVMVREAPVELGESGAVEFLSELVRTVEGSGGRDLKAFLEFHVLRSLACHSAIKINTPLARGKMDRIVHDLFATSTPMVCPHGRPIIVRLGLDEILRGLRRK
ncbi:MAG: DNA mismatch repair endonuclease MutL [Acidobacteriota bacterium]